MSEKNNTFTFTFKGKDAELFAERFAAYFWDGGLDQVIKEGFVNEFGMDLDSVQMGGTYRAIVDCDKAKSK